MKKKILSLLLVVALIATACLALAACNDNNDDDKNKPGGELKGSVKIWWPGGSPTIEAAINKAKTE